MKYKKKLLVAFLFSLFVFQQAQADTTKPAAENPDGINIAPVKAPYPVIWVYMLRLNDKGEIRDNPPVKCLWNNDDLNKFGCGNGDPQHPQDPIHYQNPIPIDVERFYLKDVLAPEMDVAEIPATPDTFAAMKAQAVAARTFASWKAKWQYYDYYGDHEGYINNSTDYQVYIPGYSDQFPDAQAVIDQAISETSEQFLSIGDGYTIDAEFGSDVLSDTQPGGPNFPYLTGVSDPISTTCGAISNYNGSLGMSQRGAIRWALGDRCAMPSQRGQYNRGEKLAWPVHWNDYRQILAHYYTGITLMGGTASMPDYRWNLLKHNAPILIDLSGDTHSFDVTLDLQNTSKTNWVDDVYLVWKFQKVGKVVEEWTKVPTPININAGAPTTQTISITPTESGEYMLYVDMELGSQHFHDLSSGWPQEEIPIMVNGVTPVDNPGRGFYPYGVILQRCRTNLVGLWTYRTAVAHI